MVTVARNPRRVPGFPRKREADQEIKEGRGAVHESPEEMFDHLDTLGSSDD
jgi:hypothetical protein